MFGHISVIDVSPLIILNFDHRNFWDRIKIITWHYIFPKKYKLAVRWGGTLESNC